MIITTIFFLSSNIGLSQNIDSLIIWSSDRKLAWEDFKGVKKDSSFTTAETLSGISLIPYSSDNKNYKYKVYAYFDIYNSFTNNNDNEDLLRHEQLHFDISELFARKIRKEFDLESKKTTNPRYMKIYKRLMSEYKHYQFLYDLETTHGVILDEQEKWQKKVALELDSLKQYKF